MSTASSPSRRAVAPWGGRHVTTIVCVLAFLALANAVSGGARLLYTGGPELHALRLVVGIAAAIVFTGWALVRVRAQWALDGPEPVALGWSDPAPSPRAAAGGARPRWLRWARVLLQAGVCAAAVLTIQSQWGTFETAFGALRHLHWRELRWGIYAEALAMVAFAQLMRLLLRAGGVTLRMGAMIGLTLASNAVALTLPGGPAWAATFSYDQLRRRGVRGSVSVYALAVTWLMSAAALVLIVLVGIDLAGSAGPAAPFRVAATASVLIVVMTAIATVVLARRRDRIGGLADRVAAACARSGRLSALVARARESLRELHSVRLSPRLIVRCFAAAALNWVFDCGCLVFSILAVGGHVPWQGILACYGLTQLAAALPITPGGIGVVEGTLSLLLIAYHVPASTAIAGVMLYRVISFWLLVPVGWSTVMGLVVVQRRRGHDRSDRSATIATTGPAVAPRLT